MAAKPSSSSSEGLKKLEEQLTCPICLEHFTNPKVLPCFHSFCFNCLKGVPTDIEKGSHYIACPTCRLACPVPDKGLATLPASFVINNFIEVYSLMKKVSGDTHASCDNCNKTDANQYCKQCTKFFCSQCLHFHDNWKDFTGHQTISLEEVASMANQLPTTRPEVTEYCTDHNKPLEIFCETCQELICHNCTVKKHRDHDYDVASDVYSKNRDVIVQSCLQPLNQEAERLSLAIANLATRKSEVTQQGEAMNDEIEAIIIQIKNHLDETGRKLKEDVKSVVEHKVNVLERQIKEADAALVQVQECRNHVEQCVKVGTPHQVLTTKAQIVSRAENVLEQIEDKAFQPLVETDIKLVKSDTALCNDIGKIICANDPSSKTSVVPVQHVPVISPITISLVFPDGSPDPVPPSSIKCSLIPLSDSCQSIQCPVEESSQLGQYNVVLTSDSSTADEGGPYKLKVHVTVHDHSVPSGPINVPASAPVKVLANPVKTITGLNRPTGVAITDDGLVVVSDARDHCIAILDADGRKLRSFGDKGSDEGELKYPQGVAISSKGTILVVDEHNHRIQEFTMEGECISCVGTKGDGPLQFSYPFGIAVNKVTGQILIIDQQNGRLQALNPDLTFSYMFGSRGSKEGQLVRPHDVAIDNQGFVYVTDTGNYRIQKFTFKGQFVLSFSIKESVPGIPSGITVGDNNLLYVNSSGKCITVLTTSGEHIGYIMKTVFDEHANTDQHKGISINKTGQLYVCCNAL